MPTSNVSICNTQFEKSSTTFNGKPTWVNTGQNLTIKWDTINDWWYIEGWSPGEQILTGNTIAPIGEWIPVGPADYFYSSTGEACAECISSFICLSDGTTQYEFEVTSDIVNGRNTWTSGSYTIQWDSINAYWFVNGWDQEGQIINTVNIDNPLGTWTQVGLSVPQSWLATNEACPEVSFISTVSVNNVSCQGFCNGNITIIPEGGQSPYLYSIDNGITFQNSNIFNGLCEGTGEIIVRDSNGVEITVPFVLLYDSEVSSYTLNLVEFSILLINQNNYKKKQYNYNIVVSPSLPFGSSLTFNIKGKNVDTLKEPGSANFQHTWTKIVNGVTSVIPETSSQSTSKTRTCASGLQNETTTTYNYSQNLLSLNSTTPFIQVICVTDIQIVTNSSDSSCPTYAETKTSLQVSNVKLNNVPCSTIVVPLTTTNEDTIYLQGSTLLTNTAFSVMYLNTPEVDGYCGDAYPSYSNIIYTEPNVTTLNSGVVVYSDSSLNNYVPFGTYFQLNGVVYQVFQNGFVTVYCSQ